VDTAAAVRSREEQMLSWADGEPLVIAKAMQFVLIQAAAGRLITEVGEVAEQDTVVDKDCIQHRVVEAAEEAPE